ncbi:hydantoin utilization protein B [Acuticoccus sediminis]|uniref:Hydantoin utilization protein B n=1 Tax=Acuticoccus sediminis TaxID=2184697 RepID=A0A8B2NZU9_9HYPH|nr:hydantoinase B/oxoprolinase family protein [Acuticoccus sediminis]RAI02090.1 hydantoin utilization protein B [Acuticoccus sediminis]
MTDKATLQILANHFRAASEAMAYTLYRTAQSTFVKETEDFTVMLVTPDGATFSVPLDYGATWYPGLDYGPGIRAIGSYEDGDICFTNDPYAGFVATHTPDMHMWKPIIVDGELICFAAGHIHNTDMGGAVPASLSRTLTEVHQEGIRFPPSKLYEAGVLNTEILGIMRTNVRQPDQNWGDLKAFVGALNTGERKVREIIAKFGVEAVKTGMQDMLDYGESQARELLRTVPDGVYRFQDYCDEDSLDGHPCRLALKLTIDRDEAELDFTGSDPQLTSSLNVPTGGNPRHTLMLVGVYYILYSLNQNLMLNMGLTRPFRCILPEGSVVNPTFPAAVGMRSLTCGRLRSLIFGAFAQAIPERMPAAPAGSSSIVNVMTTDNRTGRRIIAAIDPIVGGSGGMPWRDGTDGSGADGAYLKNTPVEINEAEVPIEILRYRLAPGTGGAGRWRGGLGTELEFRVFSPNTRITIRNRDRSRFRPWGILGGKAGVPSGSVLNPGTGRARDLGNADFVIADPGDVFRIVSPGGGGRGSPLDREPERVLVDVQRGFLTHEQAADDYGVILAGDTIDADATAVRRAEMRDASANGAFFDFGPERTAYEATWTPKAYDTLSGILFALPVEWRFWVKHRIFEALEEDGDAGDGTARILEAYEALVAAHPQMRRALSA